MPANPYAHQDPLADLGPTRTSALAVSSLIFGIICCLPGTGIIAFFLGLGGIIATRDPERRLGGRTLAIVGLILGLLSTFAWVGLTVGTLQVMNRFHDYGALIDDIQKGQNVQARTRLTPGTSTVVSDERLAAYGAALTAEWGAYQGMPRGLGEWFSAYGQVGPSIERAIDAARRAYPGGSHVPIPVEFAGGRALAVFVLDTQAQGPNNMPQLTNLAVVDKSGAPMWLVEPPQTGRVPIGPMPPAPTGPTAPPAPITPPAPTGPPTGATGPPA
ncbi:MAG: DUF4190 domain-containing protein [Phycisphaerales bacterium]